MQSPWTRDGKIRAEKVSITPQVSGRIVELNIKDNQLAKAHEWIETITKHNDIAYYFNQAYYLLYKAEGKYKEALH